MTRLLALLLAAGPAAAEILVPARTIPARAVIMPEDLVLSDQVVPGAVTDAAQAVGMEARVALYAGRPINPSDLVPPALVERNAVVPLIYQGGGLTIATEGRALDRAGAGELIRVMNLESRTTVTARVGLDGAAYVAF